MNILKPNQTSVAAKQTKFLDAPINLRVMAANLETEIDSKSIWVVQRDNSLVSFFNTFEALLLTKLFPESERKETGEGTDQVAAKERDS